MGSTIYIKARKWSYWQIAHYIAVFALLSIMICPDVISYYPVIRYIRLMQNCVSFIAVLLLVCCYKNQFCRVTLYLFLAFLFATVLNNSNYGNVLYYFSKSFGLIIVLYCLYRTEKKACWRALSDYFAVFIYLNTLISIVYPQGIITIQNVNLMDKGIYLLGECNQIMPYYLIAITLAKVYTALYGEKQRRVPLLFIACFVSGMIYMSSTAIIGIAVYTLVFLVDFRFLFVRLKNQHWGRRQMIILAGAISLLYYLVVVVRIQNRLNDLIFLLFKKDATFSTRTTIWDYALQMIKEKILFGYGGTATKYVIIGSYEFNCHNIFLQIMIMGGIVMTSVFIWMVILAIINNSKIENGIIQRTYIALFMSFFIMSMTEVYALSLVIFILFLPILVLENQTVYPNMRFALRNGVINTQMNKSVR